MRRAARILGSLIAAFCLVGAASAQAGERPFKLALVLWRGCEAACTGFVDLLEQRGVPVEIIQYNAAQDADALGPIVEALLAEPPDLLVTWGTTVSTRLLGRHDETGAPIEALGIPALFMIVSHPVGSGLVPGFSSSGREITGVRYLLPEETQIRVAKSYLAFEHLGVIYNPTESNSVLSVTNLEALQSDMGFNLTALPVPLDARGQPDRNSIPSLVAKLAEDGADAIYQGPDSFLNRNSSRLSDAALDQRLPVFSAGEGPVREAGALLGVTNSYYVVGQMTAQLAKRILLEDADPSDIPIALPQRYSVVINMDSASALGLYPPMNLMRLSELVGGDAR